MINDKLETNIKEKIEASTYDYMVEALAFCQENVDANSWSAETTKKAFNYYNYFYNAYETGYFCGACRSKVNKALKKMIDRLLPYVAELNTSDLKEQVGENYGVISILKIRGLLGL